MFGKKYFPYVPTIFFLTVTILCFFLLVFLLLALNQLSRLQPVRRLCKLCLVVYTDDSNIKVEKDSTLGLPRCSVIEAEKNIRL